MRHFGRVILAASFWGRPPHEASKFALQNMSGILGFQFHSKGMPQHFDLVSFSPKNLLGFAGTSAAKLMSGGIQFSELDAGDHSRGRREFTRCKYVACWTVSAFRGKGRAELWRHRVRMTTRSVPPGVGMSARTLPSHRHRWLEQ